MSVADDTLEPGARFRYNVEDARALLKACPLPGVPPIRSAAPGWELRDRVVCLEQRGGECRNDNSWFGSNYDTEQLDRPSFSATTKFILSLIVAIFLAWQIAITIMFAVLGYYDMSMFTFWNYTLLTLFFALLFAALFYERWLLTFVLLFVMPILLGTTFIVWVAIVIIVARNENIFLGNGSTSVSKRHTGDWIVHDVPPMMMLITMTIGFAMYARRALGYHEHLFRTRTRAALYAAYFVLSPLVPLAIYTASFSIAEKYPTGIPTGILWLLLIVVCLLWQLLMYGAFTVSADVSVRLTTFGDRRHHVAGNAPPTRQPLHPPPGMRVVSTEL